jgi:hypothetical protein
LLIPSKFQKITEKGLNVVGCSMGAPCQCPDPDISSSALKNAGELPPEVDKIRGPAPTILSLIIFNLCTTAPSFLMKREFPLTEPVISG